MKWLAYYTFQCIGIGCLVSWAVAEDAPRWLLAAAIIAIWCNLLVLVGDPTPNASAPHPKARR